MRAFLYNYSESTRSSRRPYAYSFGQFFIQRNSTKFYHTLINKPSQMYV